MVHAITCLYRITFFLSHGPLTLHSIVYVRGDQNFFTKAKGGGTRIFSLRKRGTRIFSRLQRGDQKKLPPAITCFYRITFFFSPGPLTLHFNCCPLHCLCEGGPEFFHKSQRANQKYFPIGKGGPEFFHVCKGGDQKICRPAISPLPVKNDSSLACGFLFKTHGDLAEFMWFVLVGYFLTLEVHCQCVSKYIILWIFSCYFNQLSSEVSLTPPKKKFWPIWHF